MESVSKRRRQLLLDRSVPGRKGVTLPGLDVPLQETPAEDLLRSELLLPEVSEGEVVRYFTHLSQLNFSIDTNFYPLGSCTMKYNPKVNEEVAGLPGFALLHPRQPTKTAQGTLELMYRLQGYLMEVTGLSNVSLAPLAGAHGELCGILMFRAYHRDRGETERKKVLIPDSAHGTNPASAAMGGFRVVTVPSDKNGNMDLEVLRKEATPDLAGIMFTLPDTLGLFDANIVEVCQTVHEAGGLVYGDGANMNALLGRVRLGDLGFDVVHLNLHKTFSTPHGGGGPGAGPVCVTQDLAPFLPAPVIRCRDDEDGVVYDLYWPERSIGKVAAFHGNFGVLVRAFTYITLLGEQGLRDISLNAVINANYLMSRLKGTYHLPYDRPCFHEVVLTARNQKAKGVRGLDIAKRLLDYGIHAPTMYFPIIIGEALMIEPTETESKETLDAFIDALLQIDREVSEDPDMVRHAPHNLPNFRLDEARAARQPDLRWRSTSQ